MTLLQRKQQGFTIVELLIVIVLIIIFGALIVNTFNGIKQAERNTERRRDIDEIHRHLEGYNAQNDRYPTLANINDADFRAANMMALNPNALKDPNGDAQTLEVSSDADDYGYDAIPADCDNTAAGGDCTGYTLTATLEGGGTYPKSNLN